MTTSNVIQIIILCVLLISGITIKMKTRNKVKDLEGVHGIIKRKEDYKKGQIVGKFGE